MESSESQSGLGQFGEQTICGFSQKELSVNATQLVVGS